MTRRLSPRLRGLRFLSGVGWLTRVPVRIGRAHALSPVRNGAVAHLTEPFMLELLGALLPGRPGYFLDVGVNLGQTLLAARAVSPEVRYLGFEPNPDCASFCRELIRLNGFRDAHVLPFGLSDRSGVVTLESYADTPFDSSASMVPGFRSAAGVRRRDCISVHPFAEVDLPDGFHRAGLVKIDVEGGELEVLRGLSGLLETDRPWLVMEVLPAYSEENLERVARQKAVEDILAGAGYRILRIAKTAAGGLAGVEPIESFGIHGRVDLSDYLCVPDGDAATVAGLLA